MTATSDQVRVLDMAASMMVPAGWWESTIAPRVEACDEWDQLDVMESQLKGLIGRIETLNGAGALEVERARRVVDCRRGELLGAASRPGRPSQNDHRDDRIPRLHPHLASCVRLFARYRALLFEILRDATDRTSISRAKIFERLCAHRTAMEPIIAGAPRKKMLDRSPEAVQARLARIRVLAAEGSSIPQIASAVGWNEEYCREVIKQKQIVVPAERVMHKAPRVSSARVLEQTIRDAEGLTADVRLIDFREINPTCLPEWIARLEVARDQLNVFLRKLHRVHRRCHVGGTITTTKETDAEQTGVQNLQGGAGPDACPAGAGDTT